MKNLLRFECRSATRKTAVYILFGLMILLLIATNWASEGRLEYLLSVGYGAKDMMGALISNCYFLYFLGIIVSLLVCRDYEQGVIKNVYSKGFTYEKVFTAKFVFALAFAASLYVITIVIGMVEAQLVFGASNVFFPKLYLAQLLSVLAYTSFYNLICQLIKKSGYSITLVLLVPPIGELLFRYIDARLEWSFGLLNLWITRSMSLIYYGDEILKPVLISLGYIVVCYFIGLKCTKRKQ